MESFQHFVSRDIPFFHSINEILGERSVQSQDS